MHPFSYFGIILFSVYTSYSNAQDSPNQISLLSYVNDNDGSGNYYFRYNCSDGQFREERGELQDADSGEVGEDGSKAWIKVTGTFSFVGTDGKTHIVEYMADKGGFRPKVRTIGEGVSASEEQSSFSKLQFQSDFMTFNPASGKSSGTSTGSSTTGLAIETGTSSLSSSISTQNSVSSTAVKGPDPTRQYIPPTGNSLVGSSANDFVDSDRYTPPAISSKMYIPPPSDINSIMENTNLPYVLSVLNSDGLNSEYEREYNYRLF